MKVYKLHEKAKRLDNGRVVVITDVRPNGLRVFYWAEDLQDGHSALFEGNQLRPVVEAKS